MSNVFTGHNYRRTRLVTIHALDRARQRIEHPDMASWNEANLGNWLDRMTADAISEGLVEEAPDKDGDGLLRIVHVGGLDACPDDGAHVMVKDNEDRRGRNADCDEAIVSVLNRALANQILRPRKTLSSTPFSILEEYRDPQDVSVAVGSQNDPDVNDAVEPPPGSQGDPECASGRSETLVTPYMVVWRGHEDLHGEHRAFFESPISAAQKVLDLLAEGYPEAAIDVWERRDFAIENIPRVVWE